MDLRFRVPIEQDEDGMFFVECPNLPGCISKEKSRQEVRENFREAIRCYLASLKKHGVPNPPPLIEDSVGVKVSYPPRGPASVLKRRIAPLRKRKLVSNTNYTLYNQQFVVARGTSRANIREAGLTVPELVKFPKV